MTRVLETNRFLRASVTQLSVAETGEAHVLFRTQATLAAPARISSADSAMMAQAKLQPAGSLITGTLRIDAVTDQVFRVRYAEGDAVPENWTPMLVAGARGSVPLKISQTAEQVTATTKALRLVLGLNDARLEIRDHKDRLLCGIGGPESNNFKVWDACNTGICRAMAGGAQLGVECFDLAPDEAIYGLGEKFNKLNKVGQTIDQSLADALGVVTPRSYKCVPFHVSTRGYGVFFNHSSRMTYWVGSRCATRVQVALEDDFLDYFVITGSIPEILSRYQDLTGRGVMPPAWTFGYWQSKISYSAADETLEIVEQMRRHQVPCDVIHLDTFWFKKDWFCDLEFDPRRFPDPAAWVERMAEMGIKISLWQLPYIPEGSALFDEFRAVDGFVKNPDGSIYDCRVCFTKGFKGIVGVIDYTNPAAVRAHQEHFRRLFKLGVKVIKADFGEEAPVGGVYHDGTPGSRMHNLYPLLYNQALFEVTKECTGDGVIWARSAWAGCQRYPLHWGGDNSPHFDNLIPQLEGGLSLGLSGFNFWSQDIGGFLGDTGGDLLVRWMQLGMFCSHSRIHGIGNRELYKFDEKTFRICRDYIRLRYRLLPYILGCARQCVAQGLPLMRALVVDFRDDPTVWNIGDQFLFGDCLMVCPIFTADSRRRIYFPLQRNAAGQVSATCWTDWWSGKTFSGGQWVDWEAPLEQLPLFVRRGAIVPLGPDMQWVNEKPWDPLTVEVFPPPTNTGEVSCELVEDDGHCGNECARTEVNLSGSGKCITVKLGAAIGTFTGHLETRTWIVRLHLLAGERVISSRLNGKPVEAMPLSEVRQSGSVVAVMVPTSGVRQPQEIVFALAT